MTSDGRLMLEGVRVLDTVNLLSGPGISKNLADFGAKKMDIVENMHFNLGGLLIEEKHAPPRMIRRSRNAASCYDPSNRKEIDFS